MSTWNNKLGNGKNKNKNKNEKKGEKEPVDTDVDTHGAVCGSQSSPRELENDVNDTEDLVITEGLQVLSYEYIQDPLSVGAAEDKREPPKMKAQKPVDRAPARKQVIIETSDNMIRLRPDDNHFVTAHQGLLTGSEYFAENFRSNRSHFDTISFKDGPGGNRPGLDVLKAFTQWLYTQVIPLPEKDEFELLARAYVFGEKIIHPGFCNAVMNAFTDLHIRTQKTSFDGIIPLVYNMTAISSPMRNLLADMYAYTLDDDPQLVDLLEWLPSAFLVDVVAAMVRVRKVDGEGWWKHLEGEAYHYVDE